MRKTLFLFLFLFVAACSPKRDAEEFLPSENIYLSIDGGAMLGMIPLILLEDIEKETGKPIHQQIKGVMGTSTGAIVAGLITLPIINGKPATASEGLKFYKKAKEHAFSDGNIIPVPKRDSIKSEMEENLRKTFGKSLLSQAFIDLKIVAWDVSASSPFIFDSKKAKDNSNLNTEGYSAIRASISLKDLFGQTKFEFDGAERTFIDAGDPSLSKTLRIVDPTALLYKALMENLPEGETATIYSLGTGFLKEASQQTLAAQSENSRVKIVRIDPNFEALREKIIQVSLEKANMPLDEKGLILWLTTAINKLDMGDAEIDKDLGNGKTEKVKIGVLDFDTMSTIETVGNDLLKSAEYKSMLKHFKNQKLIKVAK